MNDGRKKVIRIAVIAVYVCIIVFVGKAFAERAVVRFYSDAYLKKISQGLDDETMNKVVDSFISEVAGDGLAGTFLQNNINGDDINDLYYALTYGLGFDVTAVEKASPGIFRVGIRVRNYDNTKVAKTVVELIKERYDGNIFHKLDQGLEDLESDKSQLISSLFIEAVQILKTQLGSQLLISQEYVIDVSREGNPSFENTNGEISFICFCAGIPVEAGPAESIKNEFIIYGLFLLVIILIPVVILFYKKRSKPVISLPDKKDSEIGQMPIPQNSVKSSIQGKVPVLYAMTPQHKDMLFAVHDTPILIGRDSSCCKVKFDDGTEGVSRKHCSLSYDRDKEKFVLTDLRSTYGTFLSNGIKLKANTPYFLQSGEMFFVGNNSNNFKVELKM